MKPLQSVLQKKISEPLQATEADEKTTLFLFGKVIEGEYGKSGKSNIQPIKYLEGIIDVVVYKSLWHAEVTLSELLLIKKTNHLLEKEVIQKIRVIRR